MGKREGWKSNGKFESHQGQEWTGSTSYSSKPEFENNLYTTGPRVLFRTNTNKQKKHTPVKLLKIKPVTWSVGLRTQRKRRKRPSATTQSPKSCTEGSAPWVSSPGVVLCARSVGEDVMKETRKLWCSQTDQSPLTHVSAQAMHQPWLMFLFSSDSSNPLFCYLLTNSENDLNSTDF